MMWLTLESCVVTAAEKTVIVMVVAADGDGYYADIETQCQ
jgi:hypothetical protein